ncbi:DUF4422 domain-containing protein [Anoxybacterium hadale]|uniref:DUF4422 domain-containing protein n=1 Tax=Anoxybacterium hadale TaxID=3408580 RepID=UPI003AFFCCFA
MNSKIKIYISCHKDCYVTNHPLLFPIHVGAALDSAPIPGMLRDDYGDNLSKCNRSYCELTAQYWAWKNDYADFYGFFHYRRYFSFSKKSPRPYIIRKQPDDVTLTELGFAENQMRKLIESADVIAPLAENMYINVKEQYRTTEHHDLRDLELIKEIIAKQYPEYLAAADKYLSGNLFYFCNMFIMRKEIFNQYCSWLFSILEEFDQHTDFSKYTGKAARVDGYLGERLFGIYFTWLKQNPSIKYIELARVHFEAFPGETDNFKQMRRINLILPPGTRRRSMVKRFFR